MKQTQFDEKRARLEVSIDPSEEGPIDPRSNPRACHELVRFSGPIGFILRVANKLSKPVLIWVITRDQEGRVTTRHQKIIEPQKFLPCHCTTDEQVQLELAQVYGGKITSQAHGLLQQKIGLPDIREEIKAAESIKSLGQ